MFHRSYTSYFGGKKLFQMDFLFSLTEFKQCKNHLIYHHLHNVKTNNIDLLPTVASGLTKKYQLFTALTNTADKFYNLHLSYQAIIICLN